MRLFFVLWRKQSRKSKTGILESLSLYTDSASVPLQLPACNMRRLAMLLRAISVAFWVHSRKGQRKEQRRGIFTLNVWSLTVTLVYIVIPTTDVYVRLHWVAPECLSFLNFLNFMLTVYAVGKWPVAVPSACNYTFHTFRPVIVSTEAFTQNTRRFSIAYAPHFTRNRRNGPIAEIRLTT